MRYIKAEEILPELLIREIQQYADGVTLYIPRKAGNRRAWGNATGYRAELRQRNLRIRLEHQMGATVRDLALGYHLSEKSIRRILREEKK